MAADVGAYRNITANATTQILTDKAILHRVVVNDIGTGWTITVYDDPNSNDSPVAVIVPTVTGTLEFNLRLKAGLRVVTAGTAAGDITVVYN